MGFGDTLGTNNRPTPVVDEQAYKVLEGIYAYLNNQKDSTKTVGAGLGNVEDAINAGNKAAAKEANSEKVRSMAAERNNRAVTSALHSKIDKYNRAMNELAGSLKDIGRQVLDMLGNMAKQSLRSYDENVRSMRKQFLTTEQISANLLKGDKAKEALSKMGIRVNSSETKNIVSELAAAGADTSNLTEKQIAAITMMNKTMGTDVTTALKLVRKSSDPDALIKMAVNAADQTGKKTTEALVNAANEEWFNKFARSQGGTTEALQTLQNAAKSLDSALGEYGLGVDQQKNLITGLAKISSGQLEKVKQDEIMNMLAISADAMKSPEKLMEGIQNMITRTDISEQDKFNRLEVLRKAGVDQSVIDSMQNAIEAAAKGEYKTKSIRSEEENQEAVNQAQQGGKVGGLIDSIMTGINTATGGIFSAGAAKLNEMFGDNGSIEGIVSSGFKLVVGLLTTIATSKFIGNPLQMFGSGLGKLLGGMSTKLLAGLGIGGAVVGLLAATGALDELKPAFKDFIDAMKPVLTDIMNTLVPTIKEVWQTLSKVLRDTVKLLVPVIDGVLKAVAPVLTNVIKSIVPVLDSVIKLSVPILESVFKVLTPILDSLVKTVMPIFNTIVNTLMPVFNTILEVLTPILEVVIDSIGPVIEILAKATTPVLEIIGKALQLTAPIFEFAMKPIGMALELICAPIKAIAKWCGFDEESRSREKDKKQQEKAITEGKDRAALAKNRQDQLQQYSVEQLKLIARNLSTKDSSYSQIAETLRNNPNITKDQLINVIRFNSSGGGYDGGKKVMPKEEFDKLIDNSIKKHGKASGGVFSSATPSIVGEAGKEAVVPLERPKEMKDVLSDLNTNEKLSLLKALLNNTSGVTLASIASTLSTLLVKDKQTQSTGSISSTNVSTNANQNQPTVLPSDNVPGDDPATLEKILTMAGQYRTMVYERLLHGWQGKTKDGFKQRKKWYDEAIKNAANQEGRELIKGTYAERALDYGVSQLGKPYLLRSLGKIGYVCNELVNACVQASGFDMGKFRVHGVKATFANIKKGKYAGEEYPNFRIRDDLTPQTAIPGMVFFQDARKDQKDGFQPGHIGLVYYGHQKLHASGGSANYTKEGFLPNWQTPCRGVTVTPFDNSNYVIGEFPGLFEKASGEWKPPKDSPVPFGPVENLDKVSSTVKSASEAGLMSSDEITNLMVETTGVSRSIAAQYAAQAAKLMDGKNKEEVIAILMEIAKCLKGIAVSSISNNKQPMMSVSRPAMSVYQ